MKGEKKLRSARIVEIDFLRGVLILFMVVDHFFFDFMGIVPEFFQPYPIELYRFASWYWSWDLRIAARFSILALFFLLSGISCYFSRNNLKRGLILSSLGVVISLGFFAYSKISNTNNNVYFGAISCFGLSILIYWFIYFIFHKFAKDHHRDFKWIMLALGLIIIPVGVMFGVWNVATGGPPYAPLNGSTWFQLIIGMKQFSGADWLPLFPYLGCLFIGAFLGEIIYPRRRSLFLTYKYEDMKYTLKSKSDETYLVLCTFLYQNKKVEYEIKVPIIEKQYLLYARKIIQELMDKNILAQYACHYIHQHYDNHVCYILCTPLRYLRNAICFCGHYSIFIYILHQVVLILFIFLILMACGYKLVF